MYAKLKDPDVALLWYEVMIADGMIQALLSHFVNQLTYEVLSLIL